MNWKEQPINPGAMFVLSWLGQWYCLLFKKQRERWCNYFILFPHSFHDQSFYCSMGFVYTSWVDVNTSSSSPQMEILHNTKFSKEPYYHTFTDTLKAGSIYRNQMLQWSRWIFRKCLKQLGLNLLESALKHMNDGIFSQILWFYMSIFSNSKWPIRSRWVVVSNIFMFTSTWGNDPIWLIFFNWVETTN